MSRPMDGRRTARREAPPARATRALPAGWWPVASAVLAATVSFGVNFAAADTIYLHNGRVIQTESARIEDGRVVFTQFGGTVSIPLDTVVRIVKDDEREARSAPPGSGAEGTPAGEAAGASPVEPARGEVPAVSSPVASASWDTPAYWIEHLDDVDAQIARVQRELDRLPAYSVADQNLLRFSGQARYFIAERQKWERFMKQALGRRAELLRSARKAGIPPGALRR